ncbi:MAG: hypothetical protein JXA33_06865 [Anaerolineae bacterium]|nr:hypothetical protein [Anaerolineae bacterium]
MKSIEIRRRFEVYHENQGFVPLPRAPMLHPSIPMSFVMSAGLVQIETSLSQNKYKSGDKFLLVQECFRHFDLNRVGTDDIHLTLFEMPAAFVFGPIHKSGTIHRMWTLVTSVLGIEREKIWVSYFGGGKVENHHLPPDLETFEAWSQTDIPRSHIVGLGVEDSYWIQGGGIEAQEVYRKCGPHTELFYDRGEEKGCGDHCRPGCKCGRFVEFSNSLFISHTLHAENGALSSLELPFTESVIGTERVAFILQDVASVFEIDRCKPILDTVRRLTYKDGLSISQIRLSENVIVDHIRALLFLVADGAPPPGKDGRERIIKLLIRGIVTQQLILGIKTEEFFPVLIDCVAQTFRDILPIMPEHKKRLNVYLQAESHRFLSTVSAGRRRLLTLLSGNGNHVLSGLEVLHLEKRHGMPSLLTREVLREKGLPFPEVEYQACLTSWQEGTLKLRV